MLTAFETESGQITAAALTQRPEIPAHRIAAIVATARRVVNVDGHPVLSRGERSDILSLDHDLLTPQFGLSQDPQ